jgi:fatty-acyl-CoA synthase
VELKPGATVEADALISWCRERLAGYKLPRHIVFGELPKTSTGKIQKFELRERTREPRQISGNGARSILDTDS